jgi:hypothetical protein
MAASALRRSGAFLASIDARHAGPHSHHPFAVFRKLGQGMGAGYFTVAGSSAVAAPAAPVDFSSLNGLADAFFSGGLNGPLQLAGAVFLFVSAGRCLVRFAGLILVIGAFILHAQGVSLNEVVAFASGFARRMSAAIEAFRAAPVS